MVGRASNNGRGGLSDTAQETVGHSNSNKKGTRSDPEDYVHTLSSMTLNQSEDEDSKSDGNKGQCDHINIQEGNSFSPPLSLI